MDFSLALSMATKKLCVDSVVEMATTVYYQKDTPRPGKTFIRSCCSEKVYEVITRSHSCICNIYQAGEMARLAKALLYKCEDVKLTPSTCLKKPGTVMCTCNLRAGRYGQVDP